MKTDIVIPLGGGSPFCNEELRFALRSAEKFVKDLHTVWIMSDCAPDWLQNVRILPVPDRHRRNKDANLFDKLIFASKMPEAAELLIWMCDDNAFLAPFDAEKAQYIFNPRGKEYFMKNQGNRWHQRMANTFRYLEERGIKLPYNFEPHVPTVYRKEELQVLNGIDYAKEPGFCVNMLLYGLLGRRGQLPQSVVKAHAETRDAKVDFTGKLFAGYNDAGFPAMLERFVELFPEKSKFEK